MFNKKKGFTIVELVIVIAVIAILAAVMIPTFSGVIDNANKSAAMQEARNAWTNYISTDADLVGKCYTINIDEYTFQVVKGQLNATEGAAACTDGDAVEMNVENGTLVPVETETETPTEP